ncbi:hypothetical protein L1D31_19670 [Vibrio sp. Isolate23]|uniref:hypothetical protein n=1 Tax=Vibrio sp. Isolate23 TaxID=2908533 RepID=UPI001EFD2F77|nr:hypothetical protein [Vibrio sp. Isolate23]MCG9684759.1 hypothetical protein [Vibrio sp. Isolate23]
MAYLPFYMTPEEFAEKQKQQEQEIASGRNQISWHKYDIEEPFRYFNYCISIAVSSPAYLLAYVLFERGETFFNVLMIGQAIFLSGLAYLMFGLDYRYDYTLSERGLVVKKRRNMPRWVNTAAQVMAWLGAGVCIFMVATVGPMILAGAGGLILLSFGMLKRQPDEKVEVRIGHSEDWLFSYYNTQRKVIVLYHKCDHCEYEDVAKTEVVRSQSRSGSYLFFKTVEEMRQVVNTLSQCHQLECCEISNPKSLFGLDGGRPEPLLKIPSRTMFYQKSEVDLLKQKKAPLPDWKYLYQGKFRTKEEITKLQSQPLTAAK